jgi:ABC-type nitrate/sulfonate/bicarbonate transport system permease component
MWNPHAPISSKQRVVLGVAGVLMALLVWSVVSESGLALPDRVKERAIAPDGTVDVEHLDKLKENFLPAPWDVVDGLVQMAKADGELNLAGAAISSTRRVALGLMLVILIGFPIGVLMGGSSKVNALLSPFVDPLRSAPMVAVLPLVVLWFGIGETSKVVFLWMGASVFFIPMVRDAIVAVPRHQIVLAEDIGATPWEAIRHSVLPLAMPRIFDAIIVAVGIEWTYITVAEFVNAKQGLGYLIQTHKRLSSNDKVFAGIIVILVLALVTDQLLKLAKRKLFPWETE